MEHWSASSSWHYSPSGDGRTMKGANEVVSHYFPSTLVKCPTYYRGYAYDYVDGTLVRRGVDGVETLESIWTLCDAMYKDYIGLPLGGKAIDALCAMIFELRLTECRWPSQGAFECIAPDKMNTLISKVRRLKNGGAGIIERLMELKRLYAMIVYM